VDKAIFKTNIMSVSRAAKIKKW